jgi:hypothetical protein
LLIVKPNQRLGAKIGPALVISCDGEQVLLDIDDNQSAAGSTPRTKGLARRADETLRAVSEPTVVALSDLVVEVRELYWRRGEVGSLTAFAKEMTKLDLLTVSKPTRTSSTTPTISEPLRAESLHFFRNPSTTAITGGAKPVSRLYGWSQTR